MLRDKTALRIKKIYIKKAIDFLYCLLNSCLNLSTLNF